MLRALTGSPPSRAMKTGTEAAVAACTNSAAGRACSPIFEPIRTAQVAMARPQALTLTGATARAGSSAGSVMTRRQAVFEAMTTTALVRTPATIAMR